MKTECSLQCEAAAFLAGELGQRERAAFEDHLTKCAGCRAEVAATRETLRRLHAQPGFAPARDLAPLILARLHGDKSPETVIPWPRIAALAAAAAVFAGSAALWWRPMSRQPGGLTHSTATPADSVARATDWLCHTQESDGSWNAEKWGGQQRFRIALTALPALAILGTEPASHDRSTAVARAGAWLKDQQTATGAFGPDFQGAPYNQSIATLVLLHLYRRHPEAALKQSLDAALALMLQRQSEGGGWGYLHSPFADRSITVWHVEALEAASTLGWENVGPSLHRGRRWLAEHPHPQTDSDEPSDSPSATLAEILGGGKTIQRKLDFHAAYFLTTALLREHDESSTQQLAHVRRDLLQSQIASGETAGSWPPIDRWGRAGGRLYSTALASLSLEQR